MSNTNNAAIEYVIEEKRGRNVPIYEVEEVDFVELTEQVNEILPDDVSVAVVEDAYYSQFNALERITGEPLFANAPIMAHLATFYTFNMAVVDGALTPVTTLAQIKTVTGRGSQTVTKHLKANGIEAVSDAKTQQFPAFAAYALAMTIDQRQGGGGAKGFVNKAVKEYTDVLQAMIDEANETLQAAGVATIDLNVADGFTDAQAKGVTAYKADKAAKAAAKEELAEA